MIFRLFVLALVAFSVAWSQSFSGRVVGVADGDTIEVLRDGRAMRVRLHAIDCPERGQPFGRQARQYTGAVAFGKTVIVRVRDTDRYGRLVAEVSLPDGKNLNRELVSAGLAWHYRRYSNDETLARLEADARAARRGLWAASRAVPPWEFRKERTVATLGGKWR
jgi:endonuclease YncB( thermonuclease family)